MSIWDRVSDAIEETGSAFGPAWDAVKWVANADDAKGVLSWVNQFTPGGQVQAAGTALDKAYEYGLARPLATFGQAISYDPTGTGSDGVFNFLSPKTWAQMDDFWRATGAEAQLPDGTEVEGISPGQSLSGAILGVDLSLTPEGAAERRHVFHDTWYGKLFSGSIDLTLNIAGDPVVAGAKAAKFASDAANTIKGSDEAAKVVDYVKGGEAESRRIEKLGDRFGRTIDTLATLTPAEAASHPLIRDADTSGALSYTIAKALEETDPAKRRSRLVDILGAAQGDAASMDRLHARADGLEDEVRRLAEAPPQTRYEDAFSWEDNGQGAWSAFEATGEQIFSKRIARLQDEADRLRASASAHMQRVQADPIAMQKWQSELGGLRQSVVPSGFAGTTARVISGVTSPRLPGHVNIKDSTVGFEQLKATLKASKFTRGELARRYLDEWVKAGSAAERKKIAARAEAQIFVDTAKGYGLSVKAAREVYRRALAARNIVHNGLASRVYSAAPGARIAHVYDPETDELVAWDMPLAISQLEEHHLVIDPRVLGRFLAKEQNRRGLEEFAAWSAKRATLGKLPKAEALGRGAGTAVADKAEAFWFHIGEPMMRVMRIWKDAVLMRPAYIMRVQVDTQARLAAWAGASQYMLSAFAASKALGRHVLSAKGSEGLSLKNVFKEADLEQSLRKFLTEEFEHKGVRYKAVADEEDLQRLVSRLSPGAGMADLQNEINDLVLYKMRSTGDWTETAPDAPNWLPNYQRAIKKQIMNSPTSRQAVVMSDRAALRDWVKNTPEGRAEWRELAPMYDYDLDAWLTRVQSHVDHYLPDGTPRQWAIAQVMGDVPPMLGVEKSRAITAAAAPRIKNLDEVGSPAYSELKEKASKLRAEYRKLRDEHRTALGEAKNAAPRSKERKAAKANAKAAYEAAQAAGLEARKAEEAMALAKARLKRQESHLRVAGAGKQAVMTPEGGPTWKAVEKFFDNRANRMTIHGESFTPTNQGGPLWSWYEGKIRQNWYHVASELPEVIIGRAPMYRMAYRRFMNEQIDRLPDDAAITDAHLMEFRKNADKMARREVGKRLFDTSHTSNLAHHMRLIAPFFSAWEDTMRKWSGLLYDKPWLVERGKQAWEAPNDADMVEDSEGFIVDSEGRHIDRKTGEALAEEYWGKDEYVIIPGSLVPGDDMRVRKSSFNIVFQGDPWWLPGTGPLVQVPVNELAKKAFPAEAENPILRKILPFGIDTDSPFEQVLPSWWDAARDAFHQNGVDFQQQASLIMQEEMTRYALGERDTQPDIEEVLNKARNRFLFKVFTASSSPVTVDSIADRRLKFYLDQARFYKRVHGNNWRDAFLADYPEADSMTIELTANETGITASEKAWDASQRFKKAIAANPELGWAFVGPANDPSQPWNQGVYAAQRTQSLGYGNPDKARTVKSPQDMLVDIEVERGWTAYSQARQQVTLKLQEMGLRSLRQRGAEQLKEAWDKYVADLRVYNQHWSADFDTRDSGRVRNLLNGMDSFAEQYPSEAERTDIRALRSYVDARRQVRELLATREVKDLSDDRNADIAAAWDDFMLQLVEYSPGFEQMYNRVLEADDLQGDL